MRLSYPAIWFALAAALPLDPAYGRLLGSLTFEPCTLSGEGLPITVDAQCAHLKVPEDRAKPEGRQVDLAISWVPSTSKEPAPDPVFMLAGGPGQAARESYPSVSRAFREVLDTRAVILVDQRGTGDSNPLICKNEKGESSFGDDEDGNPEAFKAFAASCLAKLDADVRYYTTSDAVQDLDAVRAAIGAEQINLVGISYGTRVAQEFARRYPQHTRAVVLDSVVPATLILGSEHAKNLEAALDLQFARCAKSEACTKQLGEPRQTLSQLLAQVRAAPPSVRYHDPQDNSVREEPLTADRIGAVVRLYAYSPEIAAMLPLALHEAMVGRPEALMAQSAMLQSLVGEQIMHGMQLSVICAEDVDLLQADPADADTVLGTVLITAMQQQCSVWPHGQRPADFHQPLVSDTPALVLSGEFDPVTPPRYGDAVVATLSKGRHLILRGQGHNVIGAGCMPKLLAKFLVSADAKALDAKCLEQLNYVPPFAGYYGWEP